MFLAYWFLVNLCNESPVWLVAMETKIPKSIGISDMCGLSGAETNEERERKDYEYFTLITQCFTRTLNDNVIIYIYIVLIIA